jgi:hypothetical protein
LPAEPLVVRRRYLIVVPGPLPAALRRPFHYAKAGSAAALSQREKSSSTDVQRGGFIPRGELPGRVFRGGRATADACLKRSYAACACGIKPRREPSAALPRANKTIVQAVNRHKREVSDFARGTKTRRGHPTALPGADVLRDGAHCPCVARHAAIDNIFFDGCSGSGSAVPVGGGGAAHSQPRRSRVKS